MVTKAIVSNAEKPMKQRPLIGVTGPSRRGWSAWTFTRYALRRAGARTCRITPDSPLPSEPLHGLIIGGGDDIDPARYGEMPKLSIKINRKRDDLEWHMLSYAQRDALPVLGICRGAQLLNIYYGGSLHQDLVDVFENLVLRRTVLPRKRIHIKPDTPLAAIMKTTRVRINSLHHQAVNRLASGFHVAASDEDGIIQAIYSERHPFLLGVQWHPEYLPQIRSHRHIFTALVQAAKQRLTAG